MTAPIVRIERPGNGRDFPVVTIGLYVFDRMHGSWLLRHGGKVYEPDAAGIDPEDLQSLPEVKRFDRERKAAIIAAALAAGEGLYP